MLEMEAENKPKKKSLSTYPIAWPYRKTSPTFSHANCLNLLSCLNKPNPRSLEDSIPIGGPHFQDTTHVPSLGRSSDVNLVAPIAFGADADGCHDKPDPQLESLDQDFVHPTVALDTTLDGAMMRICRRRRANNFSMA